MNAVVDHPQAGALGAMAVPDWARGVWQRELLERPGAEDRTTRVIWVQTPLLFADLRSPPPGAPGEEQGFAGHLLVSGQICAWQHPLDVHPAEGPGDAGAMYRNGERLVECGIHANYLEEWRQVEPGTRHLAATRGEVRIDQGEIVWPASGPLEIVVACGGHVVHGIRKGRSASLRHGRFDAPTGGLEPAWRVGVDADPAEHLPWTLWSDTMTPVARDALLGQLAAL